jgi:hypothetical protein
MVRSGWTTISAETDAAISRTVWIVPSGVTLRIRRSPAMKRFPAVSAATLTGHTPAKAARPPSPLKVLVPLPATVDMEPSGVFFSPGSRPDRRHKGSPHLQPYHSYQDRFTVVIFKSNWANPAKVFFRSS